MGARVGVAVDPGDASAADFPATVSARALIGPDGFALVRSGRKEPPLEAPDVPVLLLDDVGTAPVRGGIVSMIEWEPDGRVEALLELMGRIEQCGLTYLFDRGRLSSYGVT
jgi:hypothetical protein